MQASWGFGGSSNARKLIQGFWTQCSFEWKFRTFYDINHCFDPPFGW